MKGSLRQRGEQSWQLRVHVGRDPGTGRYRYVEQTLHGTKREAQRALAAMVAEADTLKPRGNRESTVDKLLTEWLDHAKSSFSPRTIEVTRGYVETAIRPALGRIPVAKLTTTDIDWLYRHLLAVGGPKGPYSPATIRRVHGILRRALSQGVRWGWLRQNPAINASPPKVVTKELSPPEPEQVARLFRVALETNPTLATFVLVAASTGARRGELLALRWSDVDFAGGTLSIERGIVLAGDQLIEQGTKTHQSRRISLDRGTADALREHLARWQSLAAELGTTIGGHEFVFCETPEGTTPMRPDSTTRAFRALCRKAGVKDVRLHDLRHYVATRLLAAGVDVRTVAGRLGHSNPSTTLNVYSHFVPAADREAAATLGRLLDNALVAAG